MYFGDVITAMVTPFKEDGSVNYEKAAELADYLVTHGSDGVIVGATTGENPSLTKDEMATLYREVKAAVGNKGKVMGGAGGNNTANVAEFIKQINPIGLDGYLSVTPYYNKPSKKGLLKHFTTLDSVAESPIMLYNVPGRTGICIDAKTVCELAKCDNIVAIKESTGSIDGFSELLRSVPDDFHVYSGDDYMTLPAVAMGAAGVISVASHIVGEEIKEMVVAVKEDNLKKAQEIHLKLYPFFKGMFFTANPIPVKMAMNLMGFGLGGFRSPLCEGDEEEVAFLEQLLKQYNKL